MQKRLKLAGIGCGGRTRTYLELAARQPDRYEIVAAADPLPERVARIHAVSGNPDFRAFKNDHDFFAEPKMADVVIIGTQDNYHVEPCLAALERGYDVLLEKPIATRLEEVIRLEQAVARSGRRVMICHVLRFTPIYRKIKQLLAGGVIGEIVALDANEGVGPFHQTHSYVRGHWAVTEKATPMIIAKCCHDMDILGWLVDKPCRRISSFGSLRHFTAAAAPPGAPSRCSGGCPHLATCPYNAYHYYSKYRDHWFSYIHDDAATMTPEAFEEWLNVSPWGRCVYHCDNTAVDRQTVMLDFEDGIVATFTMTAFDEGRSLTVRGTKGRLVAGDLARRLSGHDIVVDSFIDGSTTLHDVTIEEGGYETHAGGDAGLMQALFDEMTRNDPAEMSTSIHRSVASHVLGFAAEASRQSGTTIDVRDFYSRHVNSVKHV